MGQQEIAIILKNNFPKYLSYQEIMIITGNNKQSVLRCLKQMQKRDEVQIKTIISKKLRAGWKNLYRLNGGI